MVYFDPQINVDAKHLNLNASFFITRSVEGSGRHPVDLCVCVYRSGASAAGATPGSEVSLGPLVVASRRQVMIRR